MPLYIVILAAGQGKRMNASIPKVLQPLAGKPLIRWVLATAETLNPEHIFIIYGHGRERLKAELNDFTGTWIEQLDQRGTGHAVSQVLSFLPNTPDPVLVLYGDVPFISFPTLQSLLTAKQQADLTLLTAILADPHGYGRIIREEEQILRIVEQADASPLEQAIKEINSGILVTEARYLHEFLPELTAHNEQQELYLTDLVKLVRAANLSVNSMTLDDAREVLGINTMKDLAQAERHWQRYCAEQLMAKGVRLVDPDRLDIRGTLQVGRDVVIEPNVIISGNVVLGDGVIVGANTVLHDSKIACRVIINPNSVIESSTIGPDCVIGPFARLRPGVVLGEKCRVGNFVELKKSVVGPGSKINHLTYVGDATIGEQVTIGAGTITCNYDGINKHPTVIGDNAFIGSGTQLIAPITIGEEATIGAGSTLRKDAPPKQLTLTERKQLTITSWRRPIKTESSAN